MRTNTINGRQYLIARARLWRVAAGDIDDAILVPPGSDSDDAWEWALEQGVVAAYPVGPVERTLDGGTRTYIMPPADPMDPWSDITGVPCPVPGCGQQLVWAEAGYVPGYRVCMRRRSDGGYEEESIRHRFTLQRQSGSGTERVLVLEEEDDPTVPPPWPKGTER